MGARRRHKQKPAVVSGPVEIPAAEHELVIERVAAIDVAKAAGKVCVRLPGRSGRRFSRVWDVSARTGAITDADPDPHASIGGANPIRVDPAIEAECALRTVERLDEIPGIGVNVGQVILAEIGLDMSHFPTPAHLVSWAKAVPAHHPVRTGHPRRQTGKGNPYLKGALGDAAAAAAKTDTFLGERYRRIVKRRGKLKALVAVARSILVIIWHLLADPNARFRDLGPDYHTTRTVTERKLRNHIAQLAALGYRVTLEPAA